MRKIILLAILGAVAAGVYFKLRAKPEVPSLKTMPTKPTLVTKPTLPAEQAPDDGDSDGPVLSVVADITDDSANRTRPQPPE